MDSALSRALEDRRLQFNALFAAARRQYPRLDGQAFLTHLRERVGPILQAADPATSTVLMEALYSLSLSLMGADLMGDGSALAGTWSSLLPVLVQHLSRDPYRIIGSLSNAVVNMSSTPGVRLQQWQRLMATVGPTCPDPDTLLAVGQIAAWQAGMAHYRTGALAQARRLPSAICRAALELPPGGETSPLLDRLDADPWLHPQQADTPTGPAPTLQIVARTGGFRGFGGVFCRPPTIQAGQDTLYASDGDSAWHICADVFGTTLHRTDTVPAGSPGNLTLASNGEVVCGPLYRVVPRLAGARSWASTSHTLAAAVYRSHWVYLVAPQRSL